MSEPKFYAVGDIHGMYNLLYAAYSKFKILDKDSINHLIFLGDYIDRGGLEFETLELLVNIKDELKERCHFILGNHEYDFLSLFSSTKDCFTKSFHTYLLNGGWTTLKFLIDEKLKDTEKNEKLLLLCKYFLSICSKTATRIDISFGNKEKNIRLTHAGPSDNTFDKNNKKRIYSRYTGKFEKKKKWHDMEVQQFKKNRNSINVFGHTIIELDELYNCRNMILRPMDAGSALTQELAMAKLNPKKNELFVFKTKDKSTQKEKLIELKAKKTSFNKFIDEVLSKYLKFINYDKIGSFKRNKTIKKQLKTISSLEDLISRKKLLSLEHGVLTRGKYSLIKQNIELSIKVETIIKYSHMAPNYNLINTVCNDRSKFLKDFILKKYLSNSFTGNCISFIKKIPLNEKINIYVAAEKNDWYRFYSLFIKENPIKAGFTNGNFKYIYKEIEIENKSIKRFPSIEPNSLMIILNNIYNYEIIKNKIEKTENICYILYLFWDDGIYPNTYSNNCSQIFSCICFDNTNKSQDIESVLMSFINRNKNAVLNVLNEDKNHIKNLISWAYLKYCEWHKKNVYKLNLFKHINHTRKYFTICTTFNENIKNETNSLKIYQIIKNFIESDVSSTHSLSSFIAFEMQYYTPKVYSDKIEFEKQIFNIFDIEKNKRDDTMKKVKEQIFENLEQNLQEIYNYLGQIQT